MPRRLVLVRHAKAASSGADDRERPLTERGRRQSALLGERLAAEALGETHALVSPAVRARETWDLAAEQLPAASHEVVEALYSADPGEVLEVVRTSGSDADTLAVVGHNPTIADLVWRLAGDAAGGVHDELRNGGYSPGTTAVFEHDGGWTDVDDSALALVRYVPPQA